MINEEDILLCFSAVEEAWEHRFSEFTEAELAEHLNGLVRMVEGEIDLEGFIRDYKSLFHMH